MPGLCVRYKKGREPRNKCYENPGDTFSPPLMSGLSMDLLCEGK